MQNISTSLEKVKDDLDQFDLGLPTSRLDAISLANWFDEMYPKSEMARNIAIKELIKQVSVQCIDRGKLVEKVFQLLFDELD